MALQTVTLKLSYAIHDTWTAAFVGTRHLVYDILPDPGRRASMEVRTLSQLALIGSNQLMEIALFRLLLPYAKSADRVGKLTESLLRDAKYFSMLDRWVPAATGKPVRFSIEPFFSTEKLRKKRNDTIHKTSAPVSVAMARSALSTAVQGSIALHAHFGEAFPYAGFLEQWPLRDEGLFSTVTALR